MTKTRKVLQEGQLTNSLFRNRFEKNKNVLFAITGPTGSGKSYTCLRQAELWYQLHFNKPFPIENVCFSNGEAMKLLSSGKLPKGSLLIFEEAGVNLGSLDFQSKIAKMMQYTLQSFRSMNVGLIINLPVLTMLNKSARLLLHGHMITESIDFKTKQVKLKCLMHQLNQHSGKSYWKYPRVKVGNKYLAIQRLSFGLPSKELIDAYELKKAKFLAELTQEYSREFDKLEADKIKALSRPTLTRHQLSVWEMLQKGMKVKEIAVEQGTTATNIYKILELIEKKGYSTLKPKELPQKPTISNINDNQAAF